MKRRLLLAGLFLLLLLVGMVAYVAIGVGGELAAARDTLDAPVEELDDQAVREARGHLENVRGRLGTIPARILRLIPVLGTNLDAVDGVAAAALPVLDAGLRANDAIAAAQAGGAFSGGRINPEAVAGLRPALHAQVASLSALEREASRRRGGALIPPLWSALDGLLERAHALRLTTERLERLAGMSDGLLGADAPRRYLIMLINNAELRGAGGILAGVGTITVRDGGIRLGRLYSREELVRQPYRRVPAPPDYERRFAKYLANTTLWVNATFSPDVPDDAIVCARLFQLVTGVHTDGALVVDPRGLAALMGPDDTIEVAGAGDPLDGEALAQFIYSDAYDVFSDQDRRRTAILEAGGRALEAVLGGGFATTERLAAAGGAFSAGHLRFVSFDPEEQAILDELSASGDLAPPASDSLLVTVQNFGGGGQEGSKLDFWAEREVAHACDVRPDGSASCSTLVTLRNRTPAGLTEYVAGKPYGLLRSYVEVYVPGGAALGDITVEDASVLSWREEQAGHRSVAVYLEIPRGEERTFRVAYELPSGEGMYRLSVVPQPLARDARLILTIALPDDWVARGPVEMDGAVAGWQGDFDQTLRIEASPDARSGLSSMWDGIVDFWGGR